MLAHPLHDVSGRGPGPEDGLETHLLEPGDVPLGDDAAREEDHIVQEIGRASWRERG